MAELKTKKNEASVDDFLARTYDEAALRDCRQLVTMMRKATGAPPTMWGPSIIGFGAYRYVYQTGRSGDWFLAGFSPRKGNLSLYIMAGFAGYPELMKKLGTYKTGKSCLYIKRLSDIDTRVLNELITSSVKHMKHLQATRDVRPGCGSTGEATSGQSKPKKSSSKKAAMKATSRKTTAAKKAAPKKKASARRKKA